MCLVAELNLKNFYTCFEADWGIGANSLLFSHTGPTIFIFLKPRERFHLIFKS